jgi:imidazolonepropionase-like amidohydrolase
VHLRVGQTAVIACLLLAGVLAPAQERAIALKATTVLDGKGNIFHDATILVRGSKIVIVGNGTVPTDAEVYDLGGLTVTPGWIDTHSHVMYHFNNGRLAGRGEPPEQAILSGMENAAMTLNAGFTTLQSPGANDDKYLRDAIARGILAGPRILTSLQPITDPSLTPDRIREIVRERKQQGADFIKVFASKSIREGGEQTLSDEQLQAACGEAKAQGLRTIVHAHSAPSAKAATLAGCTSIEHGAYLTDDVFDLMIQHGTYYDPNIGLVLQNYLQNKEKYLGIGNYNEEGFAFMQKGVQIVLDTFKKALKHPGLKIIYGTDAVAGAHGRNYEEFIVRVRDGGQDPMQALISATSLSAQSLNLGEQIGCLAPGMQADIVGFDGNPVQDVSAARRAVFVMKAGEVVENLAHNAKRDEQK